MKLLNSDNNPLRIADVPVGSGAIGMTFAPGKCQAHGHDGEHRRDLQADMDVIEAWNAAAVVTLMEASEMARYKIQSIGNENQWRHMEWHHWPIVDGGVPSVEFAAAWPAWSRSMLQLLARGGRVLIHCRGGLGRTGMVAARLLIEARVSAEDAIGAVRRVRPGAIETPQQKRWVTAGKPAAWPQPDSGAASVEDRAAGAMLGLALGDALGAAIEFEPKPRYAIISDLKKGGPHRLERGQWTDDTAMALALAESLAANPALDPEDLMRRFLDWREQGRYSCTGTCFDIGNATAAALDRFKVTGNPMAGSTDDAASGNGALMRLAPVAVRHWNDRKELLRVADLQTRTTHGSAATLASSRALALMLAEAIAGKPLNEILAHHGDSVEGGWCGLHRDKIRGTGYVVDCFQAAVWAVARTTDFRSAVLLAANLGQDADTTAAVAGQLAGAVYGRAGLPREWLEAIHWRAEITSSAERLVKDRSTREHASSPEARGAPVSDGVSDGWMTRDWTLKERLYALAIYRDVFTSPQFRFATDDPVAEPGHNYGVTYTAPALDFIRMAYDYGWVQMRQWAEWRESARGRRLMEDEAAITDATDEDLLDILTCCCRADRFADGHLGAAWQAGLLTRVAARAETLLRELSECSNE